MAKKYIHGADVLRKNLKAFGSGLQSRIEDELLKSAETVRTHVVADINRQKLGPGVKPVAGPGRAKHIASPPGGPPNTDTGNLVGRYMTTVGRMAQRSFSRVVAGVRYALWLEKGTRRMLPRPHLEPRYNEEIPKLQARLRAIVPTTAARIFRGRT